MDLPDDEIVRRAQRGDREAIAALIRRFERPALAVAFAVLAQPESAGDVVQAPTLRIETEMPDVDEYEVRVYNGDHRRVAAIELVSPSNKDRPETRRAFAAKYVALLLQHVSVTIVDVVTTRDFNLYAELLELLHLSDTSLTNPPTNLYTVTCRGTLPRRKWLVEAWHRPLAVGEPLPPLPIWLADDLVITLDLESSYEETCRVLRIA